MIIQDRIDSRCRKASTMQAAWPASALGHRTGRPDLFTQFVVENFQVDIFEQSLDGFGADAGFEFAFPVLLPRLRGISRR
jgi:hypothetical protein